MTEDDLALCLMLNACLKNEKKVGVVQLGHHRWFGLISSMNEGITDCLVLHVLSPKLPPYDLMAWTESTPPALISTLAPPYSPLSTAFPIKKAKRLRDREGRLLDPVHLARRPEGNWDSEKLRNGWLAQAGEEENKPPPSVRMEQPQQHLLPTHTQPQSLPPGLNVTGPPYFGTFNRPARQQADEVEKWDTDATDYNIWYNKKCGDYRSKRIDGRESAAHRCQILKDAGITRSDENSYICVYFARGKCVRGADCTFHHRIPDERDEARLDITYDVFGRERHRTDRDDMGGVGTFSRDNRTLYIGGVRRVKGVDLQELVVRNFIEFGELESVRVIWDKSIAFVRYKLRAASEFAKEAMADQSLGYKEVLNVRWANDDPNPRSQREKAFAVANQAYNAVMAHGGSAPYPDMSTLGTGDAYPTTDGQYGEAVVPAEYQQALQYASTYYPGTTHQPLYDPAAAGGVPQEESALSLLSAYDVDSYADRYGSSTDDQQQPAGEAADEQQARGAVLATTAQDQQQAQADYTSDQWRQWYMYYYGYVPAELPSAGGSEAAASMPTSGGTPAPTTPAIGPALRPHPAGVSAGGTPQEQDAPAKKLRTK